MKWEEFVEACRQKEIDCSAKQQEQFVRYAQLLQEWNEKMNLTAITEWEEVLEKRIICANAENLLEWFEPGEIKELYLNFSDPWPKARHAKRRLTHRNFLAKYTAMIAIDEIGLLGICPTGQQELA